MSDPIPAPEGGAAAPAGPGSRVLAGRYRLLHPIASGGMATVWEARDEVLGRPVAVKVLHEHLMSDEMFVNRFRAEAISAARLTHPGIVSIYDTWSADGVEAIVMELVRGTTLRHLLDHRGPLDPDEAITIADHVATALEAAHAAGIVHRDIKPANVLLSADGRVLVTDFGIAKATQGSDLTVETTMLGTAKYLAPEQVEGTPVDGRADIYALGVVLYEMLCGRVPFQAETEAATALARLHRLPDPPRQHRPALSPSLEAVIVQCLARRPDDRPSTAGAVRRLLVSADRRLDATAVPPLEHSPATAPVAFAGGQPPQSPADRAPLVSQSPQPHQPPPAARPDIEPAAPTPAKGSERPRSVGRWLVGGLVLVGLVVVAVLIGALANGVGQARAVAIASTAAFDPLGSPPGEEHNAEAPLAGDGDPSTAWTTERYRDPANLGKPGVGLVVQLGSAVRLADLVVTSPSANWSATIYTAAGAPPATLEGWGEPVADRTALAAGRERFGLSSRRGDAVLIWITRVGDDGQVAIAEVEVTGR